VSAENNVRAAYHDEAGAVLFEEVEQDGKPWIRRPNGNGGYVANAEGVARVLWNLPALCKHLATGRHAGPVHLTEGTSDAKALVAHLAAEGLPGVVTTNPFGALAWRAEFTELLTGAPDLRAYVDNDDAGRKRAALLERELGPVVEELRILRTPLEHKGADLRDHLEAGMSLSELIEVALGVSSETSEKPRKGQKLASASQTPLGSGPPRSIRERPELALEPDILALFRRDLKLAGIAGEQEAAQLLHLMVTSRLLQWGKPTNRPVSGLPKGTSSSGKSALVEAVLRFFPESAYLNLGSMSKRYLVYMEESLAHRFLIVPEYASIADDEEIVAMLRTLLSEGRVVHGTVDGEGKRKARRIEKERPTGLLVTTTRAGVDPELETRCLSFLTDDSPEQTRRVFEALAALEDEDESPVDFAAWQELQAWLAEAGEARVVIPYVVALAELMPTGATRLRRDFVSMLSLIRAHAILHQATREHDERGRILASLQDYAAVRGLIGNLIAEGVGAAVSPVLRATVEAVRELLDEAAGEREYVSVKAIADRLKIGMPATYDRVRRALASGYLVNLAKKDERGLKIAVGGALPGSEEYLPSPAEVARSRTLSDRPIREETVATMRDPGAVSDSRTSRMTPQESEEADRSCPECDRPEWCAARTECWVFTTRGGELAFAGSEPGVDPKPDQGGEPDGVIPF
jgi:hypothetical protein